MTTDQLPLFGFKDMRPRVNVPLDKALVMKGKKLYDRGDMKGAAEAMREIRYKLEDFCKRIDV